MAPADDGGAPGPTDDDTGKGGKKGCCCCGAKVAPGDQPFQVSAAPFKLLKLLSLLPQSALTLGDGVWVGGSSCENKKKRFVHETKRPGQTPVPLRGGGDWGGVSPRFHR
eukprot:SAG11_NODE_1024_length_6148_cov_7.090263_6_plen_110_part_00